jgi:hypothetical protein
MDEEDEEVYENIHLKLKQREKDRRKKKYTTLN